jgi:hypothetical protein
MTIKFVCSCGKHLKARDEMAARRTFCPRCGSPVGIPALKPTHAGTPAAPLSPLERLRHARKRPQVPAVAAPPGSAPEPESQPPPAARPIDIRRVRLLSSRGTRPAHPTGRHLEEHWYECLLYPLRALRLCLGLALFLTVLSAVMAVFLPLLLAEPRSDPWALALLRLACVLVVLLTIGLPCSFLECVLNSAAEGEVYYIRWSGNALLTALLTGAKWLTSFLAGPVVFAGLGWLYWLNCGEPGLVDWLILTELGIVAIAYWVFALLAVTDRGRLRDLNPLAVADLAYRLGWRALAVVLGAALLLSAHGLVLLAGVAEVHNAPFRGGLILALGWASSIFWSTFFCRLLGIWCHRSRQPLAA